MLLNINKALWLVMMFTIPATTFAQNSLQFADSIRRAYHIPELGYAVVSSDSVYEMQVLGLRKINTQLKARLTDRFRLGSNTKAITGFIAALLVKQGKISWDTKFFDLFPEMSPSARKEYRQLTLLNLLSFRTKLFQYTYTYPEPREGHFKGNGDEQRYQFTKWFFQHDPIATTDSINFSNLAYVAAGLMLEKASGKAYKELVNEFGKELGVQFGFGRPNATDTLQTWGHNAGLVPEGYAEDYKLEWLLAAGNINCTLPDYVKFIQLQLTGLQCKSELLKKPEFYFLHFGLPRFAIGWMPAMDSMNGQYSYNIGNPGTFLSEVYVFKDINKAFIFFANAQTDEAEEGLNILFAALKRNYARK